MVVSAGLELEQDRRLFLSSSMIAVATKAGTVSISDGFCNAPCSFPERCCAEALTLMPNTRIFQRFDICRGGGG